MQGNCEGPPTASQAADFNLPGSVIASLQGIRTGQCVILIDKSAILTTRGNKWFENLYFVLVSDSLVSTVATAVSAHSTEAAAVWRHAEYGPNLFFSGVTFHALGGIQAAQAFAITTFEPGYPGEMRVVGGQRIFIFNLKHSVLFEGTLLVFRWHQNGRFPGHAVLSFVLSACMAHDTCSCHILSAIDGKSLNDKRHIRCLTHLEPPHKWWFTLPPTSPFGVWAGWLKVLYS